MKAALFILLLMPGFVSVLFAQQTLLTEIHNNLTAHRYEFSALAKWKNKILLIPQNRRNIIDSVYLLDSAALDQSIQKNIAVPHTAYAIKNLKHTGIKKDSLYIGNILLKNYDGFEGAVVKNNTIFFTLETDTSFCYLIKGTINQRKKTIYILPDTVHIPNTYNINNAGYESLAWLPHKNALIAFFECNKDTLNARAYMCNADLKSAMKPVEWEKPLYFRLTDVFAINDAEFIGINHLFTNSRYPFERDAYLQNVNINAAEKQLTNGGNIDTCFTQLILLTLSNEKINWQPLAFISLNDKDNYEGLVTFKDGVLMIVDGEPGNNPCKFMYVRLNNFR